MPSSETRALEEVTLRPRAAGKARVASAADGRAVTIRYPGARRMLLICILPVLLFLIVVDIVPVTMALIDSTRELSLTVLFDRGQFIGLENYRRALGGELYHSIYLTVVFIVVVVPIEFALGLSLALLLNRNFYGRRFWVTILLIPTMIAPVVVGMIWRFLMMPSFGPVTYYLEKLGWFGEVPIFSNGITAFAAIMLADIWQWTPFMMLFMLAGLFHLPRDPVEAAEIDGASWWQILWRIQLPLLRPMIVLAFLFRGIDASREFDKIHVLTEGGPGTATELISVFAYRTSFVKWDLGIGAAVTLTLAFLSVVVAAVFTKIVMRETVGREV